MATHEDSGRETQRESMKRLIFLVICVVNLSSIAIAADGFSRNDFPPGFVFGSGTSAYQVEGAALEDGRTPSIWDTAAHSGIGPGGTGDVACDGYHKYKEDVQLMADVGLEAYRFSISWSRLIPSGRGPVNPKGLQYYNNLINELTRHGIQPHITLHHHDLPQALEDEYGGWISRQIVKDFTDYADVCFREFGDRVRYWATVNEPNVFAMAGYDLGFFPPQRCSSPFGFLNCSRGNSSVEPYLVVHHVLLAHASASRLYKKTYKAKQNGFVGLSMYTTWPMPYTDTKEDSMAAQRSNDFYIGWLMDPLVFGDYPKTMKKIVGGRMPAFTKRESDLVKGSADFIGVIHYATTYVVDDSESFSRENRDYIADGGVQFVMGFDPKNTSFATEYPVAPWGMTGVLEYIKGAYGNPTLFVYENGQVMPLNSSLEDTPRVEYLSAYMGAVLDAVRNGSNTRGYFTWSFLDVYELFDGYRSGFGFIAVDMNDPQRKRTPKLSATWYSQFLKGETIITVPSDIKLGIDQSASS